MNIIQECVFEKVEKHQIFNKHQINGLGQV